MAKQTLILKKMKHQGLPRLEYSIDDIELSKCLGKQLSIEFTGNIHCIACDRKIKKTFNQGYCYPCFQNLARCDMCIVKPELCHYAKGSCREPEWGEKHCLIDHVVYLARTSSLKVGVTGAHKVLERWGDQGARETLIIARVPERLLAGQLESHLKQHINDKTDWRGLLKGVVADANLVAEADRVRELVPEAFQQYLIASESYELNSLEFPVERFLEKAVVYNLDKQPNIVGELHGIIGQYLLISDKAINIRKYQGYEVILEY